MAGSISGIDWVSRMPVSGTYTAVQADDDTGYKLIDTGKADAVGFVVQVLRGGIVTGSAKASITAGVLRVEDNASTYVVTTGDVISWIVF